MQKLHWSWCSLLHFFFAIASYAVVLMPYAIEKLLLHLFKAKIKQLPAFFLALFTSDETKRLQDRFFAKSLLSQQLKILWIFTISSTNSYHF